MSTTDILIADYLKRKGLLTTLKSFQHELPLSTTNTLQYEPLENIIQDRLKYNTIETTIESTNDTIPNSHLFQNWSDETISTPVELSHNNLIIHTSQSLFKINNSLKHVLFISSPEKTVTIIDLETKKPIKTFQKLHNCVIKCTYPIPKTNRFITCGMDGEIKLFKLDQDAMELSQVQLHKRLITDLKLWNHDNMTYIISIGWDQTLKISKIESTNKIKILSEFKLLSNPTSITLGEYEDHPIIFLTRLDSTQLSMFTFTSKLYELSKISLNDAEFSNHGFTPMSISISSNKISSTTYLAIGTNHIPYMRLIIIKIPDLSSLFLELNPSSSQEQSLISTSIQRGMILGNYNTLSPQDKYSQGLVVWRTDKSGVWISGDDGQIRGLDLQNGEILEFKGHEQRIKNMNVINFNDEEIVITSGIDKKLLLWKTT